MLRSAEKPLSAREMLLRMLAAKGVKNVSAARLRSLANGLAPQIRQHRPAIARVDR